MIKMVLHRTHILDNCVKGFLTIEGSKFSCYTLEAKSIEGHTPICPSYTYSLRTGSYKCKLGTYSMYPLVPQILCQGYKNITFIKQEVSFIRPGCIAIGTNFLGEKFLEGFDEVYNALRDIITNNYNEWKSGIILKIENDPDIVSVSDGTYEAESFDDGENYNFVNL